MRIYGNRRLKTLPGLATRPTTARVREALFNIWQNRVGGCRWLDLCAGNGSMGAEALGRGAQLVVGIEQSGRACAIMAENWQKITSPDQSFQIRRGDVLIQLPSLSGQSFDLVYFDPPYDSNLYQPVLEALACLHILAPQGEIAVEHDPKRWRAITVPPLAICRTKVYGNTALTFYCLEQFWDS